MNCRHHKSFSVPNEHTTQQDHYNLFIDGHTVLTAEANVVLSNTQIVYKTIIPNLRISLFIRWRKAPTKHEQYSDN